MIGAHYSAVRDRLNADISLAGRGFDSARVDPSGVLVRDTYWILFGGGPDDLDDYRLTAPQAVDSDAEFTYTVRSVAPTADGARAEASKVTDQLIGFAPAIAGRACARIRLADSTDVEPDDSVTPPLYYCDSDFVLRSSRA